MTRPQTILLLRDAWQEYTDYAVQTAVYPPEHVLAHNLFGVLNELYELQETMERITRTNTGNPYLEEEEVLDFMHEIGDPMWYMAQLTDWLDLDLAMPVYHTPSNANSDVSYLIRRFALRNAITWIENQAIPLAVSITGIAKKGLRGDATEELGSIEDALASFLNHTFGEGRDDILDYARRVAARVVDHQRQRQVPAKEKVQKMQDVLQRVLGCLAKMVQQVNGPTLVDVGDENIRKLTDRVERGVLKGDGDHR